MAARMIGRAPEPPPSEPVGPAGAVGDAVCVPEADADGDAESDVDAAGLSPAEAEADGPPD